MKVHSFALCSLRHGLPVSKIGYQVRKGSQLLLWKTAAAEMDPESYRAVSKMRKNSPKEGKERTESKSAFLFQIWPF